MISHLDHLVLTVRDLQATVDFYVNVLGMTKEVFGGTRIALKYGQQKINLHESSNLIEPNAGFSILLCAKNGTDQESQNPLCGFKLVRFRFQRCHAFAENIRPQQFFALFHQSL